MYQRVDGPWLMGLLYYKLGLSCDKPSQWIGLSYYKPFQGVFQRVGESRIRCKLLMGVTNWVSTPTKQSRGEWTMKPSRFLENMLALLNLFITSMKSIGWSPLPQIADKHPPCPLFFFISRQLYFFSSFFFLSFGTSLFSQLTLFCFSLSLSINFFSIYC